MKKFMAVIVLMMVVVSGVYAQKIMRFGFISQNNEHWGHVDWTVGWDSTMVGDTSATGIPDTTYQTFFTKNLVLVGDSIWVVVDPDTVQKAGGRNRKIELDYTWVINEPLLSVGSIGNSMVGTWVQLEDSMLYGGYQKYNIPVKRFIGDSLKLRVHTFRTDTSGFATDKLFIARIKGFLQTMIDPYIRSNY